MPRTKMNFNVVREIALALPGAEEGSRHGAPTVKVSGWLLSRSLSAMANVSFVKKTSGRVATAPIATRKKQKSSWDTSRPVSTVIRTSRGTIPVVRLSIFACLMRADTINFEKSDGTIYERIQEMTDGRGVDCCIDAVGAEAHATGPFDALCTRRKLRSFLQLIAPVFCARPFGSCRKEGTLPVPGFTLGSPTKFLSAHS